MDDGFRERVERALKAKDWNQADLARALKCSRGAITGLLKSTAEGGVNQSPLVPDVHAVFGWSPPIPPSLNQEAGEAIELLQQMSSIDRARWIERGLAIVEEAKRRK